MDQNFSSNLRRLRKEKGFTQEQLADAVGVSAQAVSKWEQNGFPDTPLLPAIADSLDVSIDELFGRKEETPDIFNQMLQYLLSFPLKERMKQAFDLCWVMCEMCLCTAHQTAPENHLFPSDSNRDPSYSQTVLESGFLQERITDTLQYFLLMPEPEDGYDNVLSYSERYVKLFEALAYPDALRALYFLSEGNSPSSPADLYFTERTLAHALSIDPGHAQDVIERLLSVSLIEKASLDLGTKKETIYTYIPSCNFTSFMALAHTLLNSPKNFCYHLSRRSRPFFQNATYRNTPDSDKTGSD